MFVAVTVWMRQDPSGSVQAAFYFNPTDAVNSKSDIALAGALFKWLPILFFERNFLTSGPAMLGIACFIQLIALTRKPLRKRANILSAVAVASYGVAVSVPWLFWHFRAESASGLYPDALSIEVTAFYGLIALWLPSKTAVQRALGLIVGSLVVAEAVILPLYLHIATLADVLGGTCLGAAILAMALVFDTRENDGPSSTFVKQA